VFILCDRPDETDQSRPTSDVLFGGQTLCDRASCLELEVGTAPFTRSIELEATLHLSCGRVQGGGRLSCLSSTSWTPDFFKSIERLG
jgi:hypothetical protein